MAYDYIDTSGRNCAWNRNLHIDDFEPPILTCLYLPAFPKYPFVRVAPILSTSGSSLCATSLYCRAVFLSVYFLRYWVPVELLLNLGPRVDSFVSKLHFRRA